MEGSDSSPGPSSFSTQSNALLRKNLAFQKRNIKTNLCLVSFPIVLCVLLVTIQKVVDNELSKPSNTCGCQCIDTNGDGKCEKVCGIQYSTIDQVFTCAIPRPPEWPPLLQVPSPDFRAISTGPGGFAGLPEETCRRTNTCPATVLFTGGNQTFAEGVVQNLFPMPSSLNSFTILNGNNGDVLSALSRFALGTDTKTDIFAFIEPAFISERPIYSIQSTCNASSKLQFGIPLIDGLPVTENDAQCVQSLNIWRDNSSAVNDALFKGYRKANRDGSLNEYMAAYDFQNSSTRNFNVDIWYNSTFKNDSISGSPPALVRVVRSVNVISNAYLQFLKGSNVKMQFEFTKEMPKPATKVSLDFSSLLGPLFFTWIIELVFPVLLTYLVYEKQYNLRIMMKMHGLGDGPYWVISYGYFLLISVVYVLLFVIFGSLVGLKFFTSNDRGIQFVFFFSFINLQIVLAFLMATAFSKVKAAQAIAYIYIFGSGLLAAYLLQSFIEDQTFSRQWIVVLELVPAFSLFRGLYEFGQYSFIGEYMGTSGMRWKDLEDGENGMREVLIIIAIEWCVLLPLAYYLDQLSSQGSRIRKNPFAFLKRFQKKASFRRQSFGRVGSNVSVQVDRSDVVQEREIVEQLLREPSTDYAVISDNLKKVYPGRDGNPDKLAVEGLSLALPRGECFGFLGPNGAGKTTFINMMIGLTSRTSGNAYVEGCSIQTDMGKIYTTMGVCPQHDMLWETLTGREHLLFYGRLKNLKGRALLQAVEESLRNVNLFNGGVADKQARKYSGGMKRRLSVAISLIGDPKVVYMDEPSTGLDPASRNNLWKVVKNAKRNRAIILTTHSMEEAEYLCDRLGIFVNGSMQCIGNPKQLKARYGGSYILTMTTSSNEEQEVESLVRRLSPNSNKIYHISGTQKFEIPKEGIRIAGVFEAVEDAKRRFPIQAWGIADTTLEDVFIKVAKGSDSFNI